MLNNQSSKCLQTMDLVWKLVIQVLLMTMNIQAQHIPGYQNI